MPENAAIAELLSRARVGDEAAWAELIRLYEGRIRAYFRPRVNDPTIADDLAQETFIAIWTSLPNFDLERPLEPFLFTVAGHKLTDWLRREGRRPALSLEGTADSSAGGSSFSGGPASPGRAVSSMARSRERRVSEESALSTALGDLVTQWRSNDAWERLQCIELTLIAGWANKDAASHLGISEQTVANHKSYALRCVRDEVRKRGVQGRIADLD